MDLFGTQSQVIATDGEGGIRYFPAVVDAAIAERWFRAWRRLRSFVKKFCFRS
jgi:hypothetical protein